MIAHKACSVLPLALGFAAVTGAVCLFTASCGNPWIDAIIGDKFDKKPGGGSDGPSSGGGGSGLSALYDLEDFGGPADEYRTFTASTSDFDIQTYLNAKAASGDRVAVTVEGNHTLDPVTTQLANGTVISLRGSGTIQLGSAGSLFTVNDSASKLILRGSTLVGRAGNTASLVTVQAGSLSMHAGAITGNTTSNGGGVYINNGTFTMSEGSVSGNTSTNVGGGVYVNTSGIFIMSNGTISGNSASGGGGVVVNNSTFTMSGGSVSGNTANTYGGGVSVSNGGFFTMSGGNVSGNTASTISASGGGGVSVSSTGTFIMNGGTISGNTAGTISTSGGGVLVTGTFTMNHGTIMGYNNGHTSGHNPTLTRDICNVVWDIGTNDHVSGCGAAVWNNSTSTPLSIPSAASIPGNAIGASSGYDGDIIVP